MNLRTSHFKISAVLTAASGILWCSQSSQAALLFYDGFAAGGTTPTGAQYTTSPATSNGIDNAALVRSNTAAADGQKPATIGFSTTLGWRTSTAGEGQAGTVASRAVATGLTYSGLTTTTGGAEVFRSASNTGTQIKNYVRDLPAGVTGTTDVYFSALMEFDTTLHLAQLFLFQTSAKSLGMGFNDLGNLVILNNGAVTSTSAGVFTIGQTYLLVAHVHDTNMVDLYLNPTDLAIEANNTPAITATLTTFTTGAALTAIQLKSETQLPAGSGGPNISKFDEIHGATTWQDAFATTIPEPGSAALLIGGLAMLSFRRRR